MAKEAADKLEEQVYMSEMQNIINNSEENIVNIATEDNI